MMLYPCVRMLHTGVIMLYTGVTYVIFIGNVM